MPQNGKFKFETRATTGSFKPNLSVIQNSSNDWEFEHTVILSDLENAENKTFAVEIETNLKVEIMISGVAIITEDSDYNYTIFETKGDLKN